MSTTPRRRTDVSSDNAASLTVRLQRTGVLTNRCTQDRAESRQLTRGAARHVGLRVLRPKRRRSTSVRVAAGTWTNDCLRSKPRANASALGGAECHAVAHEVLLQVRVIRLGRTWQQLAYRALRRIRHGISQST